MQLSILTCSSRGMAVLLHCSTDACAIYSYSYSGGFPSLYILYKPARYIMVINRHNCSRQNGTITKNDTHYNTVYLETLEEYSFCKKVAGHGHAVRLYVHVGQLSA